MALTPRQIAELVYCSLAVLGRIQTGRSMTPWFGATEAVKAKHEAAVQYLLDNPDVGPSAVWDFMRQHVIVKNVFGVNDEPPFDSLSYNQQSEVFLFRSIVRSQTGWEP